MAGGSDRSTNQHAAIGTESWSMDDVKDTTLKENKNKWKTKLYYL